MALHTEMVHYHLPAALAAMQGNKFTVPAQVVRETKNEVRVVARKDGDLVTADAYFKAKKRKLATSIGGGPEFYTYEFLKKLGVGKDQVEIVAMKPADMPAALSNGSVDAIAIFDPFAFIAEKQLGGNSITFTDSSVYSEVYVIEGRESIKNDTAITDKLLKGLLAAEKFTQTNPDDAKQIVANRTKLDKGTVNDIWGSYNFQVALTPQLLDYWNREAVWAKDTGKVKPETALPDFNELITAGSLKRLNPEAVGF
ncbi:ABC transporter substrate-binding protein [Patescibacteria group bacterium]|nr:ABC transporter substrate-binding protein [Patescibacteria group bacterium]